MKKVTKCQEEKKQVNGITQKSKWVKLTRNITQGLKVQAQGIVGIPPSYNAFLLVMLSSRCDGMTFKVLFGLTVLHRSKQIPQG